MNNIFISQNKDIIIEFNKQKRLNLFNTYSTGSEYICTLRFKNNLGILLKEINTTELEIYKLIDCIYQFLELSNDMIFFFNHDTNCNNPGIMIRLEEINIDNSMYFVQMFRFITLDNDNITPSLSFDISDNLIEFVDKLYKFFIIDSNILNKDYLSTENILENYY